MVKLELQEPDDHDSEQSESNETRAAKKMLID